MYEIDEAILKDYVATANNPKYNGDWEIINSKFPEFKDIDKQILKDYVATANNPKYNGDYSIVNSKFPELFQPQEELTPEMMETGQRDAAPAYAMTEEKYAAEKKSPTESPLQDGVSADVVEEPVVEELPEDFDLAAELRKQTEIVGRDTREYGYIDPRKQMGAYPTKEFLDRANKQLLADQEFTAKKIEAEETTLAELRKKEEKQAEEERAIAEKANYELNLDEGFLKDLQMASFDMMGKKEGDVVPYMNDIYSKYGFSFRKTGIDNEMQVIAKNGEKTFIELKPILKSDQIDSSRRLQKFLKDNAIPVTKEIAEVEKNEIKNAARALNLRKVGRLNDDGTESTVLMASGEVDGKYVAYPTLFPKDPENYTSAASSWMELDGMDAIREAKNRNELFYFDTEKEAQEFAEGSWKGFSNADAEADLFFEKKGLNYMAYKDSYEQFESALDRSEFLKEAPRFEDELTEDEVKKYGDLYVNGTLRSDAGKIQGELEKKADGLRDFVNDKDYLVTRYEFDSYMQEKYDKKAQIAVTTNNISKAQIEEANDMSVEFFGIPLNELSKYQPKTNEEVDKINSIVEVYNDAMTTRQMAANQYDVANTYLNEKFEKSIRGKWLENGAAFNDAVKKAWYNGRAADAIMMESLGFTDITQSGMSWNDVSPEEVAQKIIDALSETETGKNSIVAQRFHSSKNFKDIWDTFKDDPAELALTMAAESMAQLGPMWLKIVPTTTVVGAGVGGGMGATGFSLGPVGFATTGAGVLGGGAAGFRTGSAAVSFSLEYTNAVLDAIRNSDKGYDIMNVDDVAAALQDENIWREGREIGLKRGIPIAVVDYLTSGLAGRFLKVGSVASRTTRVAAGIGERFIYDPAAEALGEFTAQVVAGQDINLKEITAEPLGGLGSKAPMAAINMYMDARSKTNVGIANDLSDISFMANESSSDGAITKWANNMERLGHITADQNQRIQENVALRREARDLLNVGSGKVPMPFTASNKVQARTMELLAARDELTSTQNRRAVFGSKVAEINAELQEIVTDKKLRPKDKQTVLAGSGVTEASRQAKGADIREGVKTYSINDKAYTREEFLSRIADMSEKQLKKANVAVKNDDSVLEVLRKRGKEIAQKVEDTSVLRPKGDDEGVDITAPTYEAPTQVTSPTAEAFATVNRNDGKGTVTLTETEYNAEMEKFAPAEEAVAPSEQITQKRQEDRDQVVLELQKAREDLGIYVDDQLFEGISEETENTVDKLDNGEPLTWAQAEKASKELYDKYKEIAAMKNDPNRMHTIEQIDNMLDFLGQEIDNLETYIQNEQANIEGETGVEPVAKAERKEEVTETTAPKTETAPKEEAQRKAVDEKTRLEEERRLKAERLASKKKAKFEEAKRKAEEAVKAKEEEIKRLEESKDSSDDYELNRLTEVVSFEKGKLLKPIKAGASNRVVQFDKDGNVLSVGYFDEDGNIVDERGDGETPQTVIDRRIRDARGVRDEILSKIQSVEKSLDKRRSELGVGKVSTQQKSKIEKAKQELTELKKQRDAIQEPSTETVDVQEPTRDRQAVGEGDVRETTEEVDTEEARLEQQVKDLEALVSEQKVDFRLRADTDPDVVVDEVNQAIVDEMNDMEVVNAEIQFTTKEERKPIDANELNSRSNNDIKVVKIEDFDGVPFMFTISDQLTTGDAINPYTGEVITDLNGGIGFFSEDAAWANVNKDLADNQAKKAVSIYEANKEFFDNWWKQNPQYDGLVPMAVVKMGEGSILSNEAVARTLFQNIQKLPVKNRKKALSVLKKRGKERLKTLKAKDKLSPVDKHEIRLYEELFRFVKSNKPSKIDDILSRDFTKKIPLGARAILIKTIGTGNPNKPNQTKRVGPPKEGSVSAALIEGRPKEDNAAVSISSIVEAITDPQMKDIEPRQVVAITGVDVRNAGAVKTNHKNYEWGVRGRLIGVLDKSIHATDAFPVTYNAAIRDVVSQESEGKRKSVGKVLSDSVPTQSGLSSAEFFAAKAKGNNQNAAKLFAFMNNAFPSVMMSTDKATFDNVMASEGVKKHLKGGEVVYGVTVGGDIYVNPDVHNSESQLFNTGIHEYGHVWTDYLQTTEKGKKLYARGVELVKQTEEYQKQLKIFNGDSKKAANEALAILIGNKGQGIADAAVNSKFQEFLLSMWKYIQSKFKLSEDLTIDEIQNLTLDEFIGTGLADIFSGKEIKLTDAQLKQLKNPEAAFSKNQSMQSIIDAGRANNFADSVIVELLKRKGYDIADINAAMGINARKRVESIETLRKRIARMKDINEARELVAKEMRAILRDSGISKYSKRTVNKVITNLKNANVNNMQKMLDGVSESIQNDKDRVARAIRYKRRAAAIKKLKSMGALKDLQAPLISLFKTDPKYLSEQTRQVYDAIINDIVNVNKKFEDRMSRDELLSSVEKVVREYSNDLSRASSVAQRIENDIDTDISTKQNLDKLLKDGKISESEYELMTRFSDMLKESKEDTGLSEAEKLQKEEAKRQAVNDDFNEAMSSMPSKLDNLNDDEKKAFKFAQTLTEKDLEGLSLEAARRLVRGLEMLNAGIVSEYLLKGKIIVEGNRDGNAVPITEISESGIIDKTASKIRTAMSNLFKSSKRDKGKAVENRLRSVPLRNLDQALKTAAKRFKSTGLYKNIFNPTAVAFESVKSNLKDIQKELENATGLLSKNQNERFKQKAKLVMYQIQREFDSNPENKEVNPAKAWIEATLKDKDSIYDESEKKIIKDLMDEFLVNGEIDAQKIFDSFTDKEKRALKIIDNQYEKIQDMAEMDAAMQGLPFIKRQNYVHLPKVTNSESSMAKEFDDFAATLSNPSLKSKLLAQRSGRVHSISFDPIETAYSASRKTVTGYHMYPIVKRAKIAFANMRNRATTKAQNDIVDSLESIYDGIVRSQYQNVSKNSVAVENVINLMMKSGYLAQLASVIKAMVELTTNALHAAIANPINFVAGIKAASGIDRKTLDAAIKNLPTAEKTRITGDADLTSKDVESNLMTGSQIFKAEETTSDFMAAANVVGKAAKTIPQKIIEFNEGLVAKPDVIVARPLFVGVFNDKFKEITGQAPNWDKIANDKAYREKFEYAINEATFDADQAVVDSAASNNPFAGIPKNVRDQNASAIKQAVMLVDRYMTRFRVFEYYSALRGVQALMGRSDITRLQGAALLSATVLRMAAYKLAMDAAINMVYQALGIDDDEDDLDKYDVSRQLLGAVVTLALGRGFGNLAQMPINYGVEYLNKEYGEGITREGDYNKYKDGMVYSKLSVAPESGDDIVADAVISSLGSYTPFAKTIARGGVLLTRGATSKKEETREKNMGEFYERIPFEVAGNLGVIPSYRDFRSIYLKNMAKEYKEMGDTSYDKLLKTIPNAGKEKKNTSDPFSYPDF